MGSGAALAALKVAVVVMAVLIVAGVVGLAVAILGRVSTPAAKSVGAASMAWAPMVLDEAAGTSLAAVSVAGDRLVLQLRGGGPDRVVVVDLHTGAAARVGLAR